MAVANSGLQKPLELLTKALNGMAEHPAILKAVFGAAGNTTEPALKSAKPTTPKLTVKQGAGIAGGAALMAAFTAIPAIIGELKDISANKDLKGKEKSKATGGAIGGALAGAAIGSVVPIVGTAIGALVGGGIGMLGGWLGRKAGEKIGEAVGKDEILPESAAVKEELESVQQLSQTPLTVGRRRIQFERLSVLSALTSFPLENSEITEFRTQQFENDVFSINYATSFVYKTRAGCKNRKRCKTQ